jgi:hypothetical protein
MLTRSPRRVRETYDGSRSFEFLRDRGVEVIEIDDPDSFALLEGFIVANPDEWLRDNGEWVKT